MTEDPAAVIDAYDAALFDLDGVVYLGPVAVPGAAEGVAQLRQRGTRVGFVTNNAARPPAVVAQHLVELGIEAVAADVVTSAQAAAHLLLTRFGPGASVLLVGGEGVADAVREAGLVGVTSADDRPVAVIQGYGFELTWAALNEAAIAIQHGAHWVATNTDPTRPTDRGLVPGNGAAVAAVQLAVAVEPEVAGKPFRPLLDDTVAPARCDPADLRRRPAGHRHRRSQGRRLDSMLVLTGSHGAADLLVATPAERPTHLGYDLRALLRPARLVSVHGDAFSCGAATARLSGHLITLEGLDPDPVDALWAAVHAAWSTADQGAPLDSAIVLAALARLDLP